MKIFYLFSLFLFLTNQLFSQKVDSIFDVHKYEAKLVFEVDSVNKDELLSRVRFWIGTTYKSASRVIDMEDKSSEVYRIILKPAMVKSCSNLLRTTDVSIDYVVIIQIKDEKIKIEMTDFYLKGNAYNMIGNTAFRDSNPPPEISLKCWDQFYVSCRSDCINLMYNFRDSVKNSSNKVEDDF